MSPFAAWLHMFLKAIKEDIQIGWYISGENHKREFCTAILLCLNSACGKVDQETPGVPLKLDLDTPSI